MDRGKASSHLLTSFLLFTVDPTFSASLHYQEIAHLSTKLRFRLAIWTKPRTYSPSSFDTWIIDESDISVQVLDAGFTNAARSSAASRELLHLDQCALRIGSISVEQSKGWQQQSRAKTVVPE